MSSFLVKPETIQRIVSLLYLAHNNGQIWASSFQSLMARHLISVSESKDRDALCKRLFELNVQAVHERYGDKDYTTMPGPKGVKPEQYRFKILDANRVQVFMSVQCLIYQCSEGNVPKTKLFKFLEALENMLARSIVQQLPEYQKGEWG